MIASQMGNTQYRGKIVWMLLTCRPDYLPIDLKRQGRAEIHIPLFYPESKAERRQMLRSVWRTPMSLRSWLLRMMSCTVIRKTTPIRNSASTSTPSMAGRSRTEPRAAAQIPSRLPTWRSRSSRSATASARLAAIELSSPWTAERAERWWLAHLPESF